jgi:hypothetical protein
MSGLETKGGFLYSKIEENDEGSHKRNVSFQLVSAAEPAWVMMFTDPLLSDIKRLLTIVLSQGTGQGWTSIRF